MDTFDRFIGKIEEKYREDVASEKYALAQKTLQSALKLSRILYNEELRRFLSATQAVAALDRAEEGLAPYLRKLESFSFLPKLSLIKIKREGAEKAEFHRSPSVPELMATLKIDGPNSSHPLSQAYLAEESNYERLALWAILSEKTKEKSA